MLNSSCAVESGELYDIEERLNRMPRSRSIVRDASVVWIEMAGQTARPFLFE
jgi:hypothetical protein